MGGRHCHGTPRGPWRYRSQEIEGYWVGFKKLKINYGQLTQVCCKRNGGGQGDHQRQNPSKGKTEGNITGTPIISTVGAAEGKTEKLFLAAPTHRLRNSRGPHCYHRSGQVDKGDALFLELPPHRAKSWLCSRLLSCHHFPHCH